MVEEVVGALEFAIKGSDLQSLRFAIDQACKAGAEPEVLYRAAKRRAALENAAAESSAKRARREAASAVKAAYGAGNLDMLAASLARAEAAGIPADFLKPALERRDDLEARQRLQRARDDAIKAVRAGRFVEGDPSFLPRCIIRALKLECDLELIQQAAVGDAETRARKAAAAHLLHCVGRGSNTKLMDIALGWAVAEGVEPEEIEAARARRTAVERALEEKARREAALSEAATALSSALQQADAAALAAAIGPAEAAGVSKEMLALAIRRLADLEETALKEELREQLEAAVAAGDPEALATAIERARKHEVSAEAIEGAQKALELAEDTSRRQQACAEATRALKLAMIGTCPDALATAVEEASRAGVSMEIVARARRKLKRVGAPQ